MTPQIDHLRKMSTVMRVSTHIYGVSKDIGHLRNMSPVLRVSTHIYGVFDEIDGKMFIFRVTLGM